MSNLDTDERNQEGAETLMTVSIEVDGEFMTRLQYVKRHAGAHGSKTDKCYFHCDPPL